MAYVDDKAADLLMRSDELDFELPAELIAQSPAQDRAGSRLLHYRRQGQTIEHRIFSDLPSLLRPGDLVVFNDAKVIPARVMLRKVTGGLVEGLFLDEPTPGVSRMLLRNLASAPARTVLHFDSRPDLSATVMQHLGEGHFELAVAAGEPAASLLERIGRMPLPPYIKRGKLHDDRDPSDRSRYQTIYAHNSGAVTAPTAGLHFTPGLLDALTKAGIQQTMVTLHVGLGTFKPLTAPRCRNMSCIVRVMRSPPLRRRR